MGKFSLVKNPFKEKGNEIFLLRGKKVLATLVSNQKKIRLDMVNETKIQIGRKKGSKNTTIFIDF